MKKEIVKDWMSTDVVTVSPTTTMPEAHQMMIAEQIRRLPVVNEESELVGIITLGDIRGAQPSSATSLSVWELNYLLTRLKVKDFMTQDPISILPDTTVGQAARVMLENRVSGLPVVTADGRIAGIITESDIFSLVVLNEWEANENEMALT